MAVNIGQRIRFATGGTISTITGYTVHTFTSSGNFVPTGNGTIEVLVVGGGGTTVAGGGGGGAVVYNRLANVTSGSPYPITVGSVSTPGGIGGISTARFNNVTITAFGGGAGGVSPGGSGVSSPNASGGGGGNTFGVGGIGAGITGSGFPGGTSGPTAPNVGGGGGASRAGGLQGGYPSSTGGIGVSYSITGISSFYGGGGGGVPGTPNGGPATAPLASFGTGNTPGAVIIRYPT